jgi:hypothetical protein
MQYHCVCQRFRTDSKQEFPPILEDNLEFYDPLEYMEDDTAFNNSLPKKDKVEENEMFKHRP